MKINPKYSLKNIGGKNIIVSDNSMHFEGIITLNDTAEYIWRKIESGANEEQIANSLAIECNVPADEIKDEVFGFIKALKGADIIE